MSGNQEGKKGEDLFEDLPNEGGKEPEKEEGTVEKEPEKEAEKEAGKEAGKEPEKEEEEGDAESKYAEIIKSKDKALREERKRRKDLEVKLAEKESFNPDEIVSKVKNDIMLDNREKELRKTIKEIPGMTKQLANKLYDTVKALPQTDSVEIAVELGISYLKEQQRLSGGEVNQYFPSGDVSLMPESGQTSSVRDSQKQQAKELTSRLGGNYQLTDEEIDKFKEMPKL